MNGRRTLLRLLWASGFAGLAALLPALAVAGTTVQTYEDGTNPSGWRYGPPVTIEAAGGNPGRYLRTAGLDTFAPQLRSSLQQHVFTGDYRARGVSSIGVDVIVHSTDFASGGRPLALILVHDNGTVGDTSDDYGAYRLSTDFVPEEGQGWASFDFEVPSQETSLPADWQMIDYSGGGTPAGDWNDVIEDVAYVIFFHGDPTFFYIFQMWDLGADNTRITELDSFACADGAVNAACGAGENLLSANGEDGGAQHVVERGTSDPFSLTIAEAPVEQGDGETSAACVYAWLAEPAEGDEVVLPKNLGAMCFGPLQITTRSPRLIWNAIGFPTKLGDDDAPGPLPVIPDAGSFELLSLPSGPGAALSVTFQGLVADGCSQGSVAYSVTNGIVVRFAD